MNDVYHILNEMNKNDLQWIYYNLFQKKINKTKKNIINSLLEPLHKTYRMENEKISRDRYGNYVKELEQHNYKYYKKILQSNVDDYHVPIIDLYEKDGKYYLKTENWGESLNNVKDLNIRDEGKRWAESKLKQLHKKGLFHGDLISNEHTIHLGNVVYKKENNDNNFKFIDMGFDPYNYDYDKSYDDNFQIQLDKEKKMLEKYTFIPSAIKPSEFSKPVDEAYNVDDIDLEDFL